MYLRFVVEDAEFDPAEFGEEDLVITSDEIWGKQHEIFSPITEVEIAGADDFEYRITFMDGSVVIDPSWEGWGVVRVLPPYAQAEAERQQGRIRTLTEVPE